MSIESNLFAGSAFLIAPANAKAGGFLDCRYHRQHAFETCAREEDRQILEQVRTGFDMARDKSLVAQRASHRIGHRLPAE